MSPDRTTLAALCAEVRWHPARAAGPHAFSVSSDSDAAAELWPLMRTAIALNGDDRAFVRGNTRQTWRYLDLPDGFTYWVMRAWINPPAGWEYNPAEGYVLNRKPQGEL